MQTPQPVSPTVPPVSYTAQFIAPVENAANTAPVDTSTSVMHPKFRMYVPPVKTTVPTSTSTGAAPGSRRVERVKDVGEFPPPHPLSFGIP